MGSHEGLTVHGAQLRIEKAESATPSHQGGLDDQLAHGQRGRANEIDTDVGEIEVLNLFRSTIPRRTYSVQEPPTSGDSADVRDCASSNRTFLSASGRRVSPYSIVV